MGELRRGISHFMRIPTQWRCLRCSYIVTSEEEPEQCPACSGDKVYEWSGGKSLIQRFLQRGP